MTRIVSFLAAVVLPSFPMLAQPHGDSGFSLALPSHNGRLEWSAPGFSVIQSSVKPNGNEIGIRGRNGSGQLTFLGFLFLFPEKAPLTAMKCRDGVLGPAMEGNPGIKVTSNSELVRTGGLPVAVSSYTAKSANGAMVYSVRAFVATGDVCGDLEIYSAKTIGADDADVRAIVDSYRLDPEAVPNFGSALIYAQLLFKSANYKEAAPIFEAALARLKNEPRAANKDGRRIVIDQAGMSYGMSGDVAKAREIFERAMLEDPDYPMNYYNLACADAEEKKLDSARSRLQQAFARKANIVKGESMPDPTKDDSFLPYRGNKEFWTFLEGLRAK
jgi:hypothetical protein